MVAPLVVVAVATTVMTLKSDTKPVKIYVKSPKGTLYWGGAGLDGPYLAPTLQALRNAGINHINAGVTNSASRDYGPWSGTILDAIRAGMNIRYEDDDDWVIASGMTETAPQFNLIGYSYGSLLAAQTANSYAKHGVQVDNLVLIASPIDRDFLAKLQNNPKIKKVTVINLKHAGDDIYAGMPQIDLLNPYFIEKLGRDMLEGKGHGHFYYAHPVPDLPMRLKLLAQFILNTGVR